MASTRRATLAPRRQESGRVGRRAGRPLGRPSRDSPIDEELIAKILVPYKLIRGYCRVTVEGLDHLPSGRAVLAANHTGWLGLDYSNLAMAVHDATGRIVRGVVHPLWFVSPRIGDVARRLGLVPAEKPLIVDLLRRGKAVVIFPEAEHGAFKPTVQPGHQYQLLEFKRGFVRAAIEARAPIVPVAILGGEEANPVLRTLALTDKLFRLPLPVPRNLLPRPVKWRISFLPPIPMDGYDPQDAADRERVHAVARDVREQVQAELQVQIRKRGNKYL